ncbi:MAG: hydrolase [Syntrophales bacterium]|nr:hydrolase [Syntrophales bacterium]
MLPRERTILVVADIQGNLYHAMDGKQTLLENNLRLIKGVVSLGLPVLVTEQRKIGATIPEIVEVVPDCQPITKDSFSCCGEERFTATLKKLTPKQIILSGIEAHICVYQTALDLIDLGYRVFLTADAIASRNSGNKEIAIRRLMTAGAVLTSTEMVLFELLKTSTDPKARDIFRIIK